MGRFPSVLNHPVFRSLYIVELSPTLASTDSISAHVTSWCGTAADRSQSPHTHSHTHVRTYVRSHGEQRGNGCFHSGQWTHPFPTHRITESVSSVHVQYSSTRSSLAHRRNGTRHLRQVEFLSPLALNLSRAEILPWQMFSFPFIFISTTATEHMWRRSQVYIGQYSFYFSKSYIHCKKCIGIITFKHYQSCDDSAWLVQSGYSVWGHRNDLHVITLKQTALKWTEMLSSSGSALKFQVKRNQEKKELLDF